MASSVVPSTTAATREAAIVSRCGAAREGWGAVRVGEAQRSESARTKSCAPSVGGTARGQFVLKFRRRWTELLDVRHADSLGLGQRSLRRPLR